MTNSKSFSYINILCLDRSHSTIANEFLAEELNGIALGEVARIIAPKGKEANYFLQEHNCSCGKIAGVCLFWGDILKSREVWKTYSGKILVSKNLYIDSSKTIKHSRFVRKHFENGRLASVYLVRDFSSWSQSVLSAMQRNGEGRFGDIFGDKQFIFSNFRLFLRNIKLFRYLEYIINNIRLILESRKYKVSYMVGSSVELNIPKLCGEKYESHMLRGNRVKNKNEKMHKWDSGQDLNIGLFKLIWTLAG